jgi:hypothetical protein
MGPTDEAPAPPEGASVGYPRERLGAIPSFARGMVVKAVEAYARGQGRTVITPELLTDVRSKWGGRFRPQA